MAVTQNCLLTVEQRSIHRACDRPTALMPLYMVADEMLYASYEQSFQHLSQIDSHCHPNAFHRIPKDLAGHGEHLHLLVRVHGEIVVHIESVPVAYFE